VEDPYDHSSVCLITLMFCILLCVFRLGLMALSTQLSELKNNSGMYCHIRFYYYYIVWPFPRSSSGFLPQYKVWNYQYEFILFTCFVLHRTMLCLLKLLKSCNTIIKSLKYWNYNIKMLRSNIIEIKISVVVSFLAFCRCLFFGAHLPCYLVYALFSPSGY
jgi:hypothetical protein